jgi:hypothetical protein
MILRTSKNAKTHKYDAHDMLWCFVTRGNTEGVIAGETQNPKPNPISFGYPNPKTVGEKSNPNTKPLDPKPVDIHPEPTSLPSLPASP